MELMTISYQLRHDTDAVVRLSDNAIIGPLDELEWEEYQQWLAEGNTPEPAEIFNDHQLVYSISDRQFFQQAAIQGFITKEDALQAVRTGFIPAPLQAIVDTISDPTDKFNAEMLLSGATEIQRYHPLTSVIGLAFGMSEQDIDTFFRNASKL